MIYYNSVSLEYHGIWDSSVCIVTSCGLDGGILIPGRSKKFSFSPQCPDWLWGPCSLLCNEYWRFFPVEGDGGVKLSRRETTYSLPLVLRSGMVAIYCNRPWRPIELWDVEAPTFSRQSGQRWQGSCQPDAPATLYLQENSWYSFLLEGESTPGL
jgi:hypothetical protein